LPKAGQTPVTASAAETANDKKRTLILDAAEGLVRRFGIKKTSMGDVATASKVSRATLYNYFSDKDVLINDLLARAQRQFCDSVEAELVHSKTLLEKVTQTVIWCRQQIASDLFLNISETEPETAAQMALNGEHIQWCMTIWPEHVQLGIASGELNPKLNPIHAADWIQRIVLTMVLFPTISLDIDDPKALRRYLELHLMAGLAA
jgi:AcrR family transcriptional regulator